MPLVRFFSLICVFLIAACGGRSYQEGDSVTVSCEAGTDCDCPTGATATCEDGICHCTVTETIEIEVPVMIGCEADTDCNCGSSESYNPSCQEEVCYCEELNEECYRLTRASTMQQLMERLIDLSTYQPPATPTYSDVPTSHPNYAAIEAATELGLTNGYGNGTFGPDDALVRAELAKLIIMVIDGLQGYTPPVTPTYLDVLPDAWYYDYVEAATWRELTQGYVNDDGTPTGYFGPGHTASSCFFDGMLIRANFPEEESTLTVALGSTNPPAQVIAYGVPEEPHLATYTFSASGGDVYIDSLIVTRGGVGQSTDWATLILSDTSNNLSVQNQPEDFYLDSNTFYMHLFIPDGEARTIKLSGQLFEFAGIGNQSYFYISSALDIMSNADNVMGAFPVSGNTFTIGAAVTVTKDSTPATQVAPGTSDVQMLNYHIVTALDLTARDTYIMVSLADQDNDVPTPAVVPVPASLAASPGDTSAICATSLGGIAKADMVEIMASSGTVYAVVTDVLAPSGACTAGTITTSLSAGDAIVGQVIEADPFDFLQVLRIIDLDSNNTLVGPYFTALPEVVASEDYDLMAGQQLNLSLRVNIHANMPVGYSVQGGIRYSEGMGGDSYFRNSATAEWIPASQVSGAVNSVMVGPLLIIN